MKNTLIAILTLLISNTAISEPTVFGLTINETNAEELKVLYAVTPAGKNKYSGGDMYDISIDQVEFGGLIKITTVFNKADVLTAVLTQFKKSKFEYLNTSLYYKYRLKNKKIPFVGNKSVTYMDGNTEIEISAQHMSFILNMNYIHLDFLKEINNQSSNEDSIKRT